MQRLRRPSPATALAALATVVALASALHSGRHVWRQLAHQQRVYARVHRHAAPPRPDRRAGHAERHLRLLPPVRRAAATASTSRCARAASARSSTTRRRFRYVGRYYLLPALEATRLTDATVVVTFFDDPKQLARPLHHAAAGGPPADLRLEDPRAVTGADPRPRRRERRSWPCSAPGLLPWLAARAHAAPAAHAPAARLRGRDRGRRDPRRAPLAAAHSARADRAAAARGGLARARAAAAARRALPACVPARGREDVAALAVLGVAAAFAIPAARLFVVKPLLESDGWVIWATRARTLFEFGHPVAPVFTDPSFPALQYPLLLPSLEAVAFRFMGVVRRHARAPSAARARRSRSSAARGCCCASTRRPSCSRRRCSRSSPRPRSSASSRRTSPTSRWRC